MGIAQKLVIAAEACGYVQKDGNNSFHKYRYASAANILGHVNDALTKAGLAVVDTLPEVVSESGSGKDRLVTARMTITVADTDTAERATFRGLGSGMDAGDKAVMKAVTAATKYAWMGAFSISTGDDPEADEQTDKNAAQGQKKPDAKAPPPKREEPPQKAQAAVPPFFLARINEIELPGEAVKVWLKHRAELSAFPVPEREAAWAALCARTEEVGKMKNAKVWLKKAIAEEDARNSNNDSHGTAS